MSLTKAKTESMLTDEEQAVRIYDAGTICTDAGHTTRMAFHDEENAADTVNNVLLTVSACDLTSGLSSFSIGVNETKVTGRNNGSK